MEGMEGLETYALGALWISSDWRPLLDQLKGSVMDGRSLHSIDEMDSGVLYDKIESMAGELYIRNFCDCYIGLHEHKPMTCK
eukprot:1403861-Amphidinium_carterae.4